MKRLARIIGTVADIGGHFSSWLILAIVAVVFTEVFMRYVLNRPPGIDEEFSGYLLVALSFLGAAYTFRQQGHVRITFIVDRLRPKAASWLRLGMLFFVFFFMLLQSLASYEFVADSFKFKMKANTWLFTPLQVPHLTIAIGFTLFLSVLIITIAQAILDIRAGKWGRMR